MTDKEKDKAPFFKRYKGHLDQGGITAFGCPKLLEEWEIIREKREHKAAIDIDPFYYQYDINVHVMLEWERYRDYFEKEYGIERDDFFWMAANLRWPTGKGRGGRPEGALMRNPWAEHIVWAMLNHNITCLLGGSGQGKTRTPLALFSMVWDYYLMTPTGARMCFSSTNKDKLSRAAWSNLADLYRNTKRNISAYAGRGRIMNSMAIRRDNYQGQNEMGGNRLYNSDGKGIMESVLIGGSSNSPEQAQARVDKMTGAHVPTAMGFLLDEYQSMPVSPMDACFNLGTHPQHIFIVAAGNPNLPDDEMGKQCEPAEGYQVVGPDDTDWIATDMHGRRSYVVHLNNDHSPGMKNPRKYWFMPTKAKRDKNYPLSMRDSMQYFRFWIGWFVPDVQQNVVINPTLLKSSGASQEMEIDTTRPIRNCISFDSAPSSIDRSVALHFQVAVEKETNLFVINFVEAHLLKKTAEESYYRDTGKTLAELCRKLKVASGDIILDNTGSHGMHEELMRNGFLARPIKYNVKPSDKLVDQYTRKKAKDECFNLRAEMALLLERFMMNGQIRGITEDFCPQWKREICSLRWKADASGDKKQAEAKDDFKKRMGFSPDILDTMMQAALHARDHHGLIPGAMGERRIYHRDNVENDVFSMNEVYDTELDFA